MNEADTRSCPECEHGVVEISKLPEGCQCTYCRKFIEIDFGYSAGLPIMLALTVGLAFGNDIDWLGYICTVLLVLFTAGYRTVVSRYIPLKWYG